MNEIVERIDKLKDNQDELIKEQLLHAEETSDIYLKELN